MRGVAAMYRILTDEDIAQTLSLEKVIDTVEHAFMAKTTNALTSPPRFSISVDGGSLVFTTGAETKSSRVIGFRVYDTFRDQTADNTHLTAVFNSHTGGFKGLVIGPLLGALRTAAINAIAIRHMARPDTRTLGILGSGFQARHHLQAAMLVRPFEQIKVYSPTAGHCLAFAEEMREKIGMDVEAVQSSEDVVRYADVLICATKSAAPVFDTSWLRPGVHINSIGPKFEKEQEISPQVAQKSEVIVTDSIAQAKGYPKSFFILYTPEFQRMIELSDVIAGKRKGRLSDTDITLFCSVGLAGTEVMVANEALKKFE
jgi:ornithine cyclodeaminase